MGYKRVPASVESDIPGTGYGRYGAIEIPTPFLISTAIVQGKDNKAGKSILNHVFPGSKIQRIVLGQTPGTDTDKHNHCAVMTGTNLSKQGHMSSMKFVDLKSSD